MKSDSPQASPFYLGDGTRSLFCIHYAPKVAARGAILFVPPFAEELNKSRRMVALQARALAELGWHVLQLDMTGCGDSSGEFLDAAWDDWLDDLFVARQWLQANCSGPLWLWGMRLGALLACASLEREPAASTGLLLWQPVASGSLHLQQFLRIKVASDRVTFGRESTSTLALLESLRSGNCVEVAGYDLPPSVALPMAEAVLTLPNTISQVRWFEISPRADAGLSPASMRIVDAWKESATVDVAVVQGPSFWQTQEIEEAPALLAATTQAFAE